MNVITINRDINVAPHAYDQFVVEGKLLVSNIFYTIQGEGPFAGEPAVFLRLAGCNIGAKEDCPWCDTKFDFSAGVAMTYDEVLGKVQGLAAGRASLLVITGGEPMLQAKALRPFLARVIRRPMRVQFETNGYWLKEGFLEELSDLDWEGWVHFVVSPKVATNLGRYRDLPAYWRRFSEYISLKYVVCADPFSLYNDIGPVFPIDSLPPGGMQVYVSGMTVYKRPLVPGEVANIWDPTLVDHQATARNYVHAADIVMRRGDPFKLSYQSHLFGALE